MLRPPTPADADAIVDLVCECDVEELGEPDYDREALEAEWADPAVDVARDARVAIGPDGGLTGYVLLLDHDVRAWTRPACRGCGIGTELREWAEALARRRGIEEVLQTPAVENTPARTLLAAAGYEPKAHHWQMGVRLGASHAAAPAPVDGVIVRPFVPGGDDRLAYSIRAAAFADIPGQPESSFEAWMASSGRGSASFDPSLWFIAEVDGQPAGMLAGQVRQGRAGHVVELAVARAARRRGVGSLLLGSAFAAFAGRGLEEATLSVRTANVGGVRLYERAGMTVRWRVDELAKRLDPT